MKTINYILQGFGFKDSQDFLKSTFGFINSSLFIKMDVVLSLIISTVSFLFGFNHLFLTAYVILLGFEWWTGIRASKKRGEKHESRKFGRMLLKIATYLVPVYILNTMAKNTEFPEFLDFSLNPFKWLYWVVLLAIVWQLFVSLLENLEALGYRYPKVLLKIINKKFYKTFDLDDENKSIT